MGRAREGRGESAHCFRKGATGFDPDFTGSFYKVHLEERRWEDTPTSGLCPTRAFANQNIQAIVHLSKALQSHSPLFSEP